MKNLVWVIIVAVLVCICMMQHQQIRKIEANDTIKIDSVVRHYSDTVYLMDSIYYSVPTVVYVKSTERKAVIIDTIEELEDTIAFENKVYHDSTYTAYVSGFMANLDSINVYNTNTIIRDSIYTIKTIRVSQKPKKWHIGPSLGFCFSNGFQPYIGIGITYGFFSY